MGWGLIRIAIVSISFLVGLMLIGPMRTSAGSKSPDILHLNEHAGGSLIVACDAGNVAIKHIGGEPGAVQLECGKGKIVVVQEQRQPVNSKYHLVGM